MLSVLRLTATTKASCIIASKGRPPWTASEEAHGANVRRVLVAARHSWNGVDRTRSLRWGEPEKRHSCLELYEAHRRGDESCGLSTSDVGTMLHLVSDVDVGEITNIVSSAAVYLHSLIRRRWGVEDETQDLMSVQRARHGVTSVRKCHHGQLRWNVMVLIGAIHPELHRVNLCNESVAHGKGKVCWLIG